MCVCVCMWVCLFVRACVCVCVRGRGLYRLICNPTDYFVKECFLYSLPKIHLLNNLFSQDPCKFKRTLHPDRPRQQVNGFSLEPRIYVASLLIAPTNACTAVAARGPFTYLWKERRPRSHSGGLYLILEGKVNTIIEISCVLVVSSFPPNFPFELFFPPRRI